MGFLISSLPKGDEFHPLLGCVPHKFPFQCGSKVWHEIAHRWQTMAKLPISSLYLPRTILELDGVLNIMV
jgi:hypothetical protein